MKPTTPLGEVYLRCVHQIVREGKKDIELFQKLPGKDNQLRARHLSEEEYIQLGRYRYTTYEFSKGIYGWGYPDFMFSDAIDLLTQVLAHPWLQQTPPTAIRLACHDAHDDDRSGLRKPMLVLWRVEFVCRDHPEINFQFHLGTLEISDQFNFRQACIVSEFLDVLWREWLSKVAS